MKLYFGLKLSGLHSVLCPLLLCIAFVCLLPVKDACAQSLPVDPNAPLIGSASVAQINAAKISDLRHSLIPFRTDFLSTVSNKDLVPNTGVHADDAPTPATASVVSSPQQTVDVTLPLDPILNPAINLDPVTGIPNGPTPYYADVTWSHTGDYLVFSAIAPGTTNYHLYIAAANGGSIGSTIAGVPVFIQQLTFGSKNERYPSLAPGDTSIVYCSDANTNGIFELVQANIGNSTGTFTITNAAPVDVQFQARHPFFTGNTIFFSGRSAGSSGPYDIFSISLNGQGAAAITQLTGGGADNDNPAVTGVGQGWVAWDSNATGYTYNPPSSNLGYFLGASGFSVGGVRNVYASTLAGANEVAMTVAGGGAFSNDHPQWSTDAANQFVSIGLRDLFFDSNRTAQFGPTPTPATTHLYYFGAFSANALVPEASANAPALTQVNTSDPSGLVSGVPSTGYTNQFDDVWPTVSQLNSAFISVAYISNRYLIDHNFDNPTTLSSLHNSTTFSSTSNDDTLGVATTISGTTTIPATSTVLPVTNVKGTGSTPVFFAGQSVIIDQATPSQEIAFIQSVGAGGSPSLTLTSPTTFAHNAGAKVIANGALLTANASIGATTIPVSGTGGFVVGETINIASTQRAVIIGIPSATTLAITPLQQAAFNGNQVYPTADQEPASLAPTVSTSGLASEILISRLVDVAPPALVRYSENTNEVVHVFTGPLYDPVTGVTNYNPSATANQSVPAGKQATFVVRLSDRQTGVGQTWLQIKDPNSYTQDSTGLEHKVFTQAQSAQFHPNENEATDLGDILGVGPGNNGVAGGWDATAAVTLQLGNQVSTSVVVNTTVTVPITTATSTVVVANSTGLTPGFLIYFGNNPSVFYTVVSVAGNTITIGPYGAGPPTPPSTVSNTPAGTTITQRPVLTVTTADINNPGPGPAYSVAVNSGSLGWVGDIVQIGNDIVEINQVNPEGPTGSTIHFDKSLAQQPSDRTYSTGIFDEIPNKTPVFLVATTQFDPLGNEVDCQAIDTSVAANDSNGNDQISANAADYHIPDYTPGFSDNGSQFDGATSRTGGAPSYWLKLVPMPQNLQDHNGGVLYYGSWTTPAIGSDYFIDVVSEDASGGPLDPTPGENWLIYDNVWGFNTKAFAKTSGILVVNDYALPQRFFARSGDNGPANEYGTESYWTDLNTDVVSWENYYSQSPAQQAGGPPGPTVVQPLLAQEFTTPAGPLDARCKLIYGGVVIKGGTTGEYFPPYTNGLGVNSYIDGAMGQFSPFGTGVESSELPASQQYDIWRILSRGPVPTSTLNAYGATTFTTPADPLAPSPTPITTLSAPSCIVWLSPNSGDAFVGSGTITDPNTQTALESFLNAGGRLHIEGKDIGFALTLGGSTINTFYNSYLNDNVAGQSFLGDTVTPFWNADNYVLAVSNRASDAISNDPWASGPLQNFVNAHSFFYPSDFIGTVFAPDPINSHLVTIANHGYFYPNPNVPADERTDASLDCYSNNSSWMDTYKTLGLTELAGTAANLNQESFYRGTNGSIVSYSSFGMATISQEVINYPGTNVPTYVVVNQRSHLEHNIVCALRTGSISGIVSNSGNGNQGVDGVVVRAVSTTPPGIVYTGISSGGGHYTVFGLPSGSYLMSGYKEGFTFQHTAIPLPVHGGDTGTYNVGISPAANGTLKVIVVDPNANGVVGATVSLVEVTGGNVPPPGTTDVTGTCVFPSVATGIYTVNVSAIGFSPSSTTGVSISSATQTTITVVLNFVSTSITGTVYVGPAPPSNPEVPIGNATVTLTNAAGAPLTTSSGSTVSATSNSQGLYTIFVNAAQLPNGTVAYVVANAAGFAPNSPVVVGVLSGTVFNPIDIPMIPEATLSVKVVDSVTGIGIPGVTITTTGQQNLGPTPTAGNGIVVFAPAAVGNYTVTAVPASWQALGYQSELSQVPNNPVTVSGQTNTAVTITLVPTSSTLTGTITDVSSGIALAGATISITDGGSTYTATSNGSGVYTINAIKSGTYTATVTDLNYLPSIVPGIVMTNGTTVTKNFQLTLNSVHQFSSGLQMISAPYDYSGETLATVLAGDFDSTTGASNVIATWLPYQNQYVKTPTTPCETIHSGIGYWARFGSAGGFLLHTGTSRDVVKIILSPGWNMIGDPFTVPEPLSSMTFFDSRGSGPISFATASGVGGPNLISPFLYTYNQGSASYTQISTGNANGASGSELAPYAGYWIEAYTTCTLVY